MDEKLRDWILAGGAYTAEEIDALRDNQVALIKVAYDAELKAAAEKAAIEAKETNTPAAAPKIEPPVFDPAECVLAYETHIATIQAKVAEYAGKADAGKIAEIQATANKTAAELKLKALNDKWPVVRFQSQLLEARDMTYQALIQVGRPVGPAIHPSQRDASPQVIEAAFCRSCGLTGAENFFSPEVMEASRRKEYSNLRLGELLLIYANANGYRGRQMVTNGNLREVIEAAFSTHTINTLLSSTGNKLLLEGFNAMPQSWREVAAVKTVSDFKAVTMYRMTADLEYEEVGPAGEIKHGTLGQESYTAQAKTYGKMLSITRQDIINDDLGAFNDLRNRLGLCGAQKLNKVFWTLWINNSSFFTGARTNLVTTSPLGESGLTTAVKAFRDMEGPDGNMMELEPKILLVPTDLEATAKKLYVSMEMRDTTASTKFQTSNIYYNQFRPVVVPELGKIAYTGYSATSWYLLADPKVLATAVMCFLDGQQSPTIESSDADFNTLGIQIRAYHDFGASFSEYRAGVKATA